MSANTRAAMGYFNRGFDIAAEDSGSHIQSDFIRSKRTRVLPKIDSRYNHPAFSRPIGS